MQYLCVFGPPPFSHSFFLSQPQPTLIMARNPLTPVQELQKSYSTATLEKSSNTKQLLRLASSQENSSECPEQPLFVPLNRSNSFLSERSSTTTTASSSQEGYFSTTSSSAARTVSGSSASQIRSRYLYKLGVIGVERGSSSSSTPSGAPLTIKGDLPTIDTNTSITTESLKHDHGRPDPALVLTVNTKTGTPQQHLYVKSKSSTSKIRFQTSVKVHSIPHHTHYFTNVKQNIWMSPMELEEMVYKNSFEYAYEGWDWNNVIEEEDFCLFAGQWTHPAHVTRYTPSRQFCMILSAQQQHQQLQQLQLQQLQQQQTLQMPHYYGTNRSTMQASHY